jgi:hypothetical protein
VGPQLSGKTYLEGLGWNENMEEGGNSRHAQTHTWPFFSGAFLSAALVCGHHQILQSLYMDLYWQLSCRSSALAWGCITGPHYSEAPSFLDWAATGFPQLSSLQMTSVQPLIVEANLINPLLCIFYTSGEHWLPTGPMDILMETLELTDGKWWGDQAASEQEQKQQCQWGRVSMGWLARQTRHGAEDSFYHLGLQVWLFLRIILLEKVWVMSTIGRSGHRPVS